MLTITPKDLSHISKLYQPANDKLDFKKIGSAGLAAELLHTDWPSIFSLNDYIDYAREQFSNHIMLHIAKFTPIRVSFTQSKVCPIFL